MNHQIQRGSPEEVLRTRSAAFLVHALPGQEAMNHPTVILSEAPPGAGRVEESQAPTRGDRPAAWKDADNTEQKAT